MATAVSQNVLGSGEIVEIEKPRAAAGSVVVRLTARPIQHFDILAIEQSVVFNNGVFVPGCEGFGIVEEVGDDVTAVRKGDRVVPMLLWTYFLANCQGSWQEFITVSAKDVIPIPQEISDEDAAQLIINPWTAYGLVQDLNASKGSYILQNCAGSVVGRIVIKLAKQWGIKTINLVRRDEVKEDLKAIGADEVFNVTKEDVIAKVKHLTNGVGVEGAIDMAAGLQTKLAAACVKPGGQVFTIGALESRDSVISVNDLSRNVGHRFWSLAAVSRKEQEVMAHDTIELLKSKIIGPFPVTAKFPLKDYEAAVEKAKQQQGKILLV